MDTAVAGPLAEALTVAGYTHDGVAALLGDQAHAALMRNETTPGLRATGGGTPAETLTRMWLLQAAVPVDRAEQALPRLVDRLCAIGVLQRSVGEVAARIDIRPYATDSADLWIASDLTPGLDGTPVRLGADHVLGISSASTSLAQLTVRQRTGRALDLGTGCGVQALHLSGHADTVVATDVNPRALAMTRFNAALNGVGLDVREGSFFDPVRGEEFDLVVTNPPFVISPATGERLVYRDSGLPGDRVVEDLVRQASAHLAPGGVCQVLANWMLVGDQPWQERLSGWVPEDCDAWVVQREVADLPTYVELWLKDSGHHPATGADPADYRRRYDTWLSWLEETGAGAVGFGWINLRRRPSTGSGTGSRPGPGLRLEEWPWEVEQPLGPEVAAHFARQDSLQALDDAALADARLVLRSDVRQETVGAPGAEDPDSLLLRQQRGMRRARQVSTAEAAFVGACDGDLPVAQLSAAVEQLTGGAVDLELVRELVAEGYLEVA